jgi:hypothetical protein
LSEPPRILGTPGNGQPAPMLPDVEHAVVVPVVGIAVGLTPAMPGKKVLFVGPVTLAIPLDENAARTIVQGLTGVELPGGAPSFPPAA